MSSRLSGSICPRQTEAAQNTAAKPSVVLRNRVMSRSCGSCGVIAMTKLFSFATPELFGDNKNQPSAGSYQLYRQNKALARALEGLCPICRKSKSVYHPLCREGS